MAALTPSQALPAAPSSALLGPRRRETEGRLEECSECRGPWSTPRRRLFCRVLWTPHVSSRIASPCWSLFCAIGQAWEALFSPERWLFRKCTWTSPATSQHSYSMQIRERCSFLYTCQSLCLKLSECLKSMRPRGPSRRCAELT